MSLMLVWCGSLLLASAANENKVAAYPRADLLMEATELAKPETARQFRILDVRSPEKFKAGHIPGASWVDVGQWSKAFHQQADEKSWRARLSQAFLDTKTRVVVYGDDVREAARVWWILRYWGVRDVRLLNGGWQAWQASNGPVDKSPNTAGVTRDIELSPQTQRLATKEQILQSLKDKKFTLVDTRSEAEHCGDLKTAKRAGSIPEATHLEWVQVLDKPTQRFKSAASLKKLFQDAGLDINRPTVTYCQSGGRAAVMAFTLELMGAKDVRNYYRSWLEWGNSDDTPIVTPKKK